MPNEQRLVAISTPLKDSDLILRQATFSETLGQPFVIEADLISADESLPFNKILGQNVTIRYETDQESRYFNGLVTGFKQNENLQRNGYYTATIRPWLWLLTLSQSCRIFQQKSYPDIIKAVFDEMGFADYQDKLRGQYPAQEYVVQFNETDFNFVARILQQEGIYYYFEHTNGKHTLILTDDSVTLNDVGEVSYFELDDSQRNIGVEGISQWRNHRHLRTGGISLSSYDFAKPNKNLDAATKDPQLDAVAPYQKYTYNGKYIERDVGEHYSKVSMERENADYEKKVLAGNYRQLSAGSRFKLTGHGRDDQNSQYLLTDYHCTLLGDDMLREQEKEDLQMLSFSAEAISAKLNFRPPQQQHKPQMRGPQTGTVVGKTGEEIWTDKYGRIKVRFHWDRQGKNDDNCSCWIRVAQSLAGKNWGSLHIPRVGQEVLIDFLHGDPDQPIVIGCVYNGSSMPPYELPAHAKKSGFKSRSSQGGGNFNEIRFDDDKGEEQLFMHAAKNFDASVTHSSYETVGVDKHLTVKQDFFTKIENSRHVNIGGDHVEQVTGDINLRIGGKEAKEVAESSSLNVQKDRAEQVGGDASLLVTNDYYLKATNICLEASANITLQVGSSFISMDSGGISIKSNGKAEVVAGGNLTVSGGGKADLTAGGPVSVSGTTIKLN